MVPAPARGSKPVTAAGRADVESVYRSICQRCHGPDGRGKVVRDAMPSIPRFTDPAWQRSRSDSQLLRSLSEGKGD